MNMFQKQELLKVLSLVIRSCSSGILQLQRPSEQEVEDFLNQEDLTSDPSSQRGNSLFLKAMDGRPRRRRSLHFRAARIPGAPQSPDPPNGRRSSRKDSLESDALAPPPEMAAQRRPSRAELLLTPLKQFVSQSQKAFEYLSPNSPDNAANDSAPASR